MKITIVSGHQNTTGARSGIYLEEVMTEVLATKIADVLKAYGHDAIEADYNLYDHLEKNGATPSILANDYILEVHFNAGGGTGSEIFVPAGASRTVERAIMKRLGKWFKLRDDATPVDGVKEGRFLILSKLAGKQPVALLEVAFIDSKSDMATYTANIDAIAKDIALGILEGHGLPTTQPGAQQDRYNGPYVNEAGEKLWFRAFAGSYQTRQEAQATVDALKKSGYPGAWLMAAFVKGEK